MHRVPAERAQRRIIDPDTVCNAIATLEDPDELRSWAARFDLLADPTRLSLLVCIHRVGPISVSDLAVAIGANDPTVSQSLRLLRDRGVITPHRDGRIIRYTLTDDLLAALLDEVSPAKKLVHGHH